MPKFRKKPVVIEAFKLRGDGPTPTPEWFGAHAIARATEAGLILKTLEGEYLASWGDYIIQGVQGEIYPCKPDIFEATYDYVDEGSISRLTPIPSGWI